jgi:hypothetical protein
MEKVQMGRIYCIVCMAEMGNECTVLIRKPELRDCWNI